MKPFDPERIFNWAQTLLNGNTQEKTELISSLDLTNPVSVSVLFRALDDTHPAVVGCALKRLKDGKIRPPETILQPLINHAEEQISSPARALLQFEETNNPLESLIPNLEQISQSLGPMGEILSNMIGGLRDMGSQNEREQHQALIKLTPDNPGAMLVIQEALGSEFLSVRVAALKKALTLPNTALSEQQIGPFLNDPDPEVRDLAQALIRAGKVGTIDADAIRQSAMNFMINNLGGGGAQAADTSTPGEQPHHSSEKDLNLNSIAEMAGRLMAENPGLQEKAKDIFNTLSQDAGSQNQDRFQEVISQLTQGLKQSTGSNTDQADPVHQEKEKSPARKTVHKADKHVYFAATEKGRSRIERQFLNHQDSPPQAAQIFTPQSPPRWALKASPSTHNKPHWPDYLDASPLLLSPESVSLAEQARKLSEQVWGAAYGDHQGSAPFTLVFHDGILTRASWGGETPGHWDAEGLHPGSTSDHLALLSAFLEDPTDDRLEDLPSPKPLYSIVHAH